MLALAEDLFGGDGFLFVAEGGAGVGEDGGDLLVGETFAVGWHGEVVVLAIDGDGAGHAVENDLDGAGGGAFEPFAVCEGWEGASGGALAVLVVACGAVLFVKGGGVLGGGWKGDDGGEEDGGCGFHGGSGGSDTEGGVEFGQAIWEWFQVMVKPLVSVRGGISVWW